ncbi:MAG: MFS transporter [Micromonosporaceae bacterium]
MGMSSSIVSQPVRIGYGPGSFCTGTFAAVPGLLLLYYMTNILGVRALSAGPAVFVPKAWDLFINPVVGRRSDATRWRHGARRPCCSRARSRCRRASPHICRPTCDRRLGRAPRRPGISARVASVRASSH